MPLLDLDKITANLPTMRESYLRDWDRMMRSAGRPETTRYNYLIGAAQPGLCVPKITSTRFKQHVDTRAARTHAARAEDASRSRSGRDPATRCAGS